MFKPLFLKNIPALLNLFITAIVPGSTGTVAGYPFCVKILQNLFQGQLAGISLFPLAQVARTLSGWEETDYIINAK
jgi:hypothetical protein